MMYQHYKGGLYILLFEATDSGNHEDEGQGMVVLQSVSNEEFYVRPEAEFEQPVLWPDGKTRPRFAEWHHIKGVIDP